jgi:heme exporter protein B
MASIVNTFWWKQVSRELLIMRRQKQSFIQAVLFFLMFVVFFPLSIPYDANLFRTIFPGVIWLSATLATFLAAERFYQQDIQYGCLEQWLVQRQPLSAYVAIKILVHGLQMMLGILVIAPIVNIIYQLPWKTCLAVIASLLAGIPAIISMCSLVSAFGAYGQDRSLVMMLVLMPLILPVIMLGSSIIAASLQGIPWNGLIAFLIALSLTTMISLPFASALILKTCIQHGN